MARWMDALEAQVRLMNWWDSPRGADYARGFAESVHEDGRAGASMYRAMPTIETMKLQRAEPVYVNENVMDLLDAAANHTTFQFEPFLAEDLFAEEGFALLPRSFYVKDANGKRCSVRAFSWGPVLVADATAQGDSPAVERINDREGFERVKEYVRDAGLHVTLYAHWKDDDDYNVEWRETLGKDMIEHGFTSEAEGYRNLWGGDLSMFHATIFGWGEMPDSYGYRHLNGMDEREEGDHDWQSLWRYVQTFFRLADQRIAIRDRVHGNRTERRQLGRIKPDNDGVLVVRLRRPSAPKNSDQYEVEWQHQWIVSGHWRRQWYPTLGRHQMIWIADHVKGPDDKPLLLHPGRVFEFVR